MIEVREYLDSSGRSLYADWFNRLNSEAAAKVAVAVVRIQQGNFSSVKGIGSGVYEYQSILARAIEFISARMATVS